MKKKYRINFRIALTRLWYEERVLIRCRRTCCQRVTRHKFSEKEKKIIYLTKLKVKDDREIGENLRIWVDASEET
jgi:hypothetical protein